MFSYRKIPSKRNNNSGNVKSVDENVLFYQQILIYLDWILYLDWKSPRAKTLQKEVFARIKRNLWRIEKSNGFHSKPSSQISSFIFSFSLESSSPLHFWRTDRKTFSHKMSFLLLVAHRESLQRTLRGKWGQVGDKEPTTIHLYFYDHHFDRWLVSCQFSIYVTDFPSFWKQFYIACSPLHLS